jgi:hypothetical protein
MTALVMFGSVSRIRCAHESTRLLFSPLNRLACPFPVGASPSQCLALTETLHASGSDGARPASSDVVNMREKPALGATDPCTYLAQSSPRTTDEAQMST